MAIRENRPRLLESPHRDDLVCCEILKREELRYLKRDRPITMKGLGCKGSSRKVSSLLVQRKWKFRIPTLCMMLLHKRWVWYVPFLYPGFIALDAFTCVVLGSQLIDAQWLGEVLHCPFLVGLRQNGFSQPTNISVFTVSRALWKRWWGQKRVLCAPWLQLYLGRRMISREKHEYWSGWNAIKERKRGVWWVMMEERDSSC